VKGLKLGGLRNLGPLRERGALVKRYLHPESLDHPHHRGNFTTDSEKEKREIP